MCFRRCVLPGESCCEAGEDLLLDPWGLGLVLCPVLWARIAGPAWMVKAPVDVAVAARYAAFVIEGVSGEARYQQCATPSSIPLLSTSSALGWLY